MTAQLSFETIRRWCDKFGQSYTAKLKRKRPQIGDKWHMDEVPKINGVHIIYGERSTKHGAVIDIGDRHSGAAQAGRLAIRFFRKLLRTSGGRRPRVMITDKLRSYGAGKRVLMPRVAHRQNRYLIIVPRTRINRLANGSGA